MKLPYEVYCDGGTIGPNPSRMGGVWAYCHVSGGERTVDESGFITPAQIGLPRVSNNYAELWAAYMALVWLPDGWDGAVYTDSYCTYRRLCGSKKFNGVPDAFQARFKALRKRLKFRAELLAGHPTAVDLARGCTGDGTPVSPHNVYCDRLCIEEANRCRSGSRVRT